MKYNAPPGGAADAPFLDGNRAAGVKGSIVPGSAVEHDQRELVHLIEFSGQAPSEIDLEQVRKAIELLIAAATGGGDTSQFILMAQARARLPIFPEIQSADGKMNVSSPASGTILVPPAVSFQHRGIYPVTTSDYIEADRTFATAANKTYHVRWNQLDGFSLKDAADGAYNPLALAESNAAFDSTYDDMLVARVVTNASNVPTIKNLANRHDLAVSAVIAGTDVQLASLNGANFRVQSTLDWARTPKNRTLTMLKGRFNAGTDQDYNVTAFGVSRTSETAVTTATPSVPVTRYALDAVVMRDHSHEMVMHFDARA